MTRAQQAYYRGKNGLWQEACRVQGWDPNDEAKRRSITLEAARAINPTSTCDTTANLNEAQITALFKLLIAYANPLDLAAQRAVANPQETQITDECRRLCYAINQYAFHRNYVQGIAKWYCRLHQVTFWEQLPADKLKLLAVTVARRARQKNVVRWSRTDTRDYRLLPARTYTDRPGMERP